MEKFEIGAEQLEKEPEPISAIREELKWLQVIRALLDLETSKD